MFAAGGDYQTGDRAGKALSAFASEKKPIAAVIGGDLAYANAFSFCYRRWDEFFAEFHAALGVPLIATLGNHDAGGYFNVERTRIPFFIRYFPFELGLQRTPPNERTTFHAHQLGPNLLVLALDSQVVADVGGAQQRWLNATLANSSAAHTFVTYHYPLYTSKPSHTWMEAFVNRTKRAWLPLFDRHRVDVAAENHMHVYKRTFALRGDAKAGDSNSTAGVTYIGDGAWGIAHGGAGAWRWYDEALSPARHVFVGAARKAAIQIDAIDEHNVTFNRILKKKD